MGVDVNLSATDKLQEKYITGGAKFSAFLKHVQTEASRESSYESMLYVFAL